MTLAAPGSRRGKLSLVLTMGIFLLAAVTAVFALTSSASAQLPLTITEIDQSPDSGSTVAPGDTVTYVLTATLTAPLPNIADGLTIEFDVDAADPDVFPGQLECPVQPCGYFELWVELPESVVHLLWSGSGGSPR